MSLKGRELNWPCWFGSYHREGPTNSGQNDLTREDVARLSSWEQNSEGCQGRESSFQD